MAYIQKRNSLAWKCLLGKECRKVRRILQSISDQGLYLFCLNHLAKLRFIGASEEIKFYLDSNWSHQFSCFIQPTHKSYWDSFQPKSFVKSELKFCLLRLHHHRVSRCRPLQKHSCCRLGYLLWAKLTHLIHHQNRLHQQLHSFHLESKRFYLPQGIKSPAMLSFHLSLSK